MAPEALSLPKLQMSLKKKTFFLEHFPYDAA